MKILADIYLEGSEIKNVVLDKLSADPIAYEAGHFYYNDVAKEIRYYDGTSWISLGSSASADKHYTHTQAIADTTWTVAHNLNKRPSVSIEDSSGNEVEGCVMYVDLNTLTIQFENPFSGKAYFN